MSEAFARGEFEFLDRDILTSDGNLVKALRAIRRLRAENEAFREQLALTTGLGTEITPEECGNFIVDMTNQAIAWRDENEVLRARVKALERVVRKLEWSDVNFEGEEFCIECDAHRGEPHYPDCELNKALAACEEIAKSPDLKITNDRGANAKRRCL
ncbi:MAG TPA: hypothetical protein VM182_13410 [Terriglobia bacterium]|nr:hypothetical protein [Terriglobia bacterium]